MGIFFNLCKVTHHGRHFASGPPQMTQTATSTPIRDFDLLKSLEIFVSVADTGSMTAAAARLHITQSAISQQIKLLEMEFGTPLFYRDIRPLRLTPAGLTLKNRAGALLLGAKQMRSEVRQAASGHLPHLRIALLSTFAKHLVPAILKAISNKSLPVDNITITRGMTINHAQDLANHEIDVAFTSDAFDAQPGLEHRELLRESYLLAMPRGFQADSNDLRSIAARLPFLRYSGRTQTGQRIESHLRRLRFDIARGASFEASADLLAAIGSGYGWSIVSPSQLLDSLELDMAIETYPLPKPGLSRAIGLVWRSGEMADTMQRLATLCLNTLQCESIPRLRAALPDTHFEILEKPFEAS